MTPEAHRIVEDLLKRVKMLEKKINEEGER
jgi:hypothetical protein